MAAPVGVTSSPGVSTPTTGRPAEQRERCRRRHRHGSVLGGREPTAHRQRPARQALHAERVQQREGAAEVHERVVPAQLVQHDVGRRRRRGSTPPRRPGGRTPRAPACGPLPGSGAATTIARIAPAGRACVRSVGHDVHVRGGEPRALLGPHVDPDVEAERGDGLARARRRGAPASSNAASTMSPARPPIGSRCATRVTAQRPRRVARCVRRSSRRRDRRRSRRRRARRHTSTTSR